MFLYWACRSDFFFLHVSSCFYINASVPPHDGREAAQCGARSRHRGVVGLIPSRCQNSQRAVLPRWAASSLTGSPTAHTEPLLFHFPAILSGEFRHHHHQLASLVLTDCLCCRSQACCGPPASGLDPQLCRGGPEFHESAGDSGVQCRSAAAWWRAQRTVQTSVCLNCDVNDTQHVIHPLKQQLHERKFLLFVMFNLFWYTVSFCSLIFKYFQQWLNVILLRFCTQVQFWGTCTLPESFHVLLPYTITGLYFRGKYNTLKFKCIHQQWKMLNIRPVSYLTHRKQYIVTCKYTCDLLLMFVHLITDVFNFYSSTIWLF